MSDEGKLLGYSLQDLESLLGQLAAFDAAGMDAGVALEVLESGARKRGVRQLLRELSAQYENGAPLSVALERVGDKVPPVIQQLVRAGEKSGDLNAALREAAHYLAMRRCVTTAFVNALIYPMALLTVGAIVSSLVAFYIVPRQWAVIEQIHLEYWRYFPQAASPEIVRYAILSIQAVAVLFLLAWAAAASLCVFGLVAPSHPRLHQFVAKLPGYGKIFSRYMRFHFATTLALQLRRNVPISDALQALANDDQLPLVSKAARSALHAVELGQPLSSGLAAEGTVFPAEEIWFVQQAERYEKLPTYFEQLAQRMEEDLARMAETIQRMEPAAVAVISVLVALFAVSVFLPVTKWYMVINLGE